MEDKVKKVVIIILIVLTILTIGFVIGRIYYELCMIDRVNPLYVIIGNIINWIGEM